MAIQKILLVDDEMIVRDFLAETLRRKNIDVVAVDCGQKAISLLKETSFDMVITDMKMPDVTGFDVLRKVKELSPSTIVIVITAFGSIENAVEAMRLGAFNYLIKPFSPDSIEAIIDKAQEHSSLVEENHYLKEELAGGGHAHVEVIGESPAIKQVMQQIAHVAKTNASVFIHGESGTGKEVVAHAIHYSSLRAARPFIKVNCAAVPETLVESEFFGHEKGAFTGANTRRLGRFELANHGTLLLDEITEIPIGLQAKLLRVIQEQEFERVGGSKPIKVDVRLLSTSNRDMQEAIQQKVIREDLYYRLNVVPIYIPPLRERREDILPLAEHFLAKVALENHHEKKTLTPEARQVLHDYNWPGNVRELANIIERAFVMGDTKQVAPEHLFIGASVKPQTPAPAPDSYHLPTGMSLQELEKKLIIETLQANQNNRTKTAEALGISLRTLRTKLQEYNVG